MRSTKQPRPGTDQPDPASTLFVEPTMAAAGPLAAWVQFRAGAADVLIKGEITTECQKALGIKLIDETINANDIQARIASSIQSGSGPDIVSVFNNWAHLYGESL